MKGALMSVRSGSYESDRDSGGLLELRGARA